MRVSMQASRYSSCARMSLPTNYITDVISSLTMVTCVIYLLFLLLLHRPSFPLRGPRIRS